MRARNGAKVSQTENQPRVDFPRTTDYSSMAATLPIRVTLFNLFSAFFSLKLSKKRATSS
jgi:hypothetical protein